jgi:hypothetical protein
MRGQSSVIAKAEQVARNYQIAQGEGVTIPSWLFAGVIALGLGVVLGPTILASTKTGAQRLSQLAEQKLRG